MFLSVLFFLILLGISSNVMEGNFLMILIMVDQLSNIIVETNDNNSVENLEKDELEDPFF